MGKSLYLLGLAKNIPHPRRRGHPLQRGTFPRGIAGTRFEKRTSDLSETHKQ
jgi:hypothetical protein